MQIPLQLALAAIVSALLLASCAHGNANEPVSAESATETAETANKLFAVEIRVGPNWDSAKPPNEQAFFSEHSSNLNRLRDAGHIVMGARYSDVGLIIFSAESADDVKSMMSEDPSMTAGTFRYAVHSFNVFYPGLVQPGSSK